MATQTDTTLEGWVTAAHALDTDTQRRILKAVSKAARGNDDDAADALPFVMTAVLAGQNIKAAAVVAVACSRKDRQRREAAAARLATAVAVVGCIRTEGTDAHPLTPTPPAWEDIRPTLKAADRTVLDALAADALTKAAAVNHPDAPRPMRVSVIAAALGCKAPRTAVEGMALRSVGVAAWSRVSVVMTPGPDTLEERGERIMRHVLRRKGTHTVPRSDGARGRIKASNPNAMATQSVRLPVLPREVREAVAARADALGVPASALAGWGATFVGSQDGAAVRAAGYRPVLPVSHARNPSRTLKGVGEGVTWGGGGAYGLGKQETPDALTAAREGRADVRDDIARQATVNAPILARINAPRPVWARGAGRWVPGASAPILAFPTWGVGGSHIRPTWDDAMGKRPDAPAAPAPVRDASDAFRPCGRPVPSTGEGAAPGLPGCGCGARRPGAALAADGAHRLVPCETPKADGTRCGCGSKAGALVSQDGKACHAPRVRRR